MINEKNITDTVSSVTRVCESIIENMAVGSRLTTKQFVTQVVQETQVPVAVAAGVTALVVTNCDTVKPRAGRGGGIFKVGPGSASSKNIAAVASALNMRDDSGNVDMSEDMSDDEGEV